MAPFDWGRLMKVDLEAFEEDQADDMYDVLSEFDPGDEKDPAKLTKLFLVTQQVMFIKATQAQVAEEELADKAEAEGTSGAKKDHEIEDLKNEIQQLRRDNKDLQRYGTEGAGQGTRETRFLRDELHEAEQQVTLLQKEVKEKDQLLSEEREISDKYATRNESVEKELRDLRREYEQMRDDIRDYQRQLEAQRETMIAKRDEDFEFKDKMTHKNKLLNAALDENRRLAEANVDLEKQIEERKTDMIEARTEMERTADQYLKLKTVVNKTDQDNETLRREKEILKTQVEDLMNQVRSKADADDEIMVQVNNKVEEWKGVLADKDERILDLQEQVVRMREQLTAANIDGEKASIAMLTKAVEERDKEIEGLRQRVEESRGELEANAALMEDVHSQMNKSALGTVDNSRRKITSLQGTINMHESQMKYAQQRADEAEEDAREKDKQLSEALQRISLYEEGVYGLPEAVAEIKEVKNQRQAKERQVEELTQYINRVEMQLNDVRDENDDFRERLGLDPRQEVDLTEFKKRKGMRLQEDRALNRVLQKEIEKMEEERIELKTQIRKMAQSTGQRAVALGLGADDLVAVDNFIEDLKVQKTTSVAAEKIKSRAVTDTLQMKNAQLDKDLANNEVQLQQMSQQNAELRAKVKELQRDNGDLEKGMREIRDSLLDQGAGSDVIQCPTLDKMLAALEMKQLTGNYDSTLYLKAQVDNLTGHNEELRKAFRETRDEATKHHVELDRARSRLLQLEAELKTLKESGAGGFFQAIPLPQGMAPTSADVISSLNEHLVQSLQEVSLKEDMLEKMEGSLEDTRRKLAVIRHQQGVLYQQHLTDKQGWEEEEKALREELARCRGLHEDSQVKVQEFDRLVDTLGQDDVEVRRRLSDLTRKITMLHVNEKALARRYTALQDMEAGLRKENTKIKADMVAMETAVAERLGYLQRYKDMAGFKIASLQKTLESSVPESDLEKLNKQHTELTEKYRDMLERTNSLVATTEQNAGYEAEVTHLREESAALKQQLTTEKEKLHTLEAAFENMRRQGMASSKDLKNNEVLLISQRLTTLEMKELNERQRADHAHNMYNQQKLTLRRVEDRNYELEQKFAEVTRMNLDGQRVERELRDELANCVTKAVSDADRQRIIELEENDAQLRNEVSKLRDIADVASNQVRSIEAQQQSREKELLSLRQQLVDFQAQSDENTVIGKLHRQIVRLQVSEGMAVRRLEDALKKITKQEAQLLRTEHKLDTSNQTVYQNRQEARSKARHLKLTIQDLRKKFSGSVPLPQQERFAGAMVKLQEDKKQLQLELTQIQTERLSVEDKLAELELRHKGLQELIATVKDGKGAQKVAEWHSKMEALRIEDLRKQRQLNRIQQQMDMVESVSRRHEDEVVGLEEDKIRMTREFEARELEWEQREVDLERNIVNMERQLAAIAGAATQFEEAIGQLPDPSWPVAKQLDHAVTSIKRNIKHMLDTKAQIEHLNTRVAELGDEVRTKEKEVVARDKVITELRLRLPASAERDNMILKATERANQPDNDDFENRHAVKVATETVAGLQTRLAQKEKVVEKQRQLLSQLREEYRASEERHQQELRAMQGQVQDKHDHTLHRLKESLQESLKKGKVTVPSNEQLLRLNELEDLVAEQDNSISGLREKLIKTRQEVQDWRYRYEDAMRSHADEKDSLLNEHQEELQQLKNRITLTEHHLEEKKSQHEITERELEEQREANKLAPSTTMKHLVEKLKSQLAQKEKQHQSLSKALLELRADMVSQAGEDAKANAEQALVELNVQKAVDRQTKDLQERIEELEAQNTRARKELKKMKDKDAVQSTELEETKHDLLKKETLAKKLKQDKMRLESEVDELEKKVHRMGNMAKQRAAEGQIEGASEVIEDLRKRNHLLMEDLKRAKHQPEKPYEQTGALPLRDTSETVAKWEEGKKWQKMADRLKMRVREKEAEIEKISRSNELLKSNLDRANRDKESLEMKLRSASRPENVITAQKAEVSMAPVTRGPPAHAMEELKKRNHQLEEEVAQLKRQLTVDRDKALEEVKVRNEMLTNKLSEMEAALASRQTPQDLSVGHSTYRELAHKESDLQKKVIALSEENIELRFEVEQANKDIPRLKKRVDDLQKYVDVLKVEKEELRGLRSSNQSLASLASSYSSSNIRRIGDSGKTTQELEKTVALLKKVVERAQAENQQLKLAPGIVSNETLKHLQDQNKALKAKLEEVRLNVGADLSERYQSQQKTTAKVAAQHDKIRQDLIKEKEENSKLRVAVEQRELDTEELRRQLAETEQRLVEASKKPTLSSLDTKDWKAAVIPRLNEEKMKSLEEEIEQKNHTMKDMKILLRDAAEREHALLAEKEELEEKINVLEAFPLGAKVKDPQLMKDYQQARLTIAELEKDKQELVRQVGVMLKDNEGMSVPDVGSSEVLHKMRAYDRLVAQNVELSTQVKSGDLERQSLLRQVSKLNQELSNFGPEFFDEIEDLKFNYRQAVQKNTQYEEKLGLLSRQLGVAVDIEPHRHK